MAEEQVANQQEQAPQQFVVQRVYSKDVSFESPSTPAVFTRQWQPKVSVDLNSRSEKIDDNGNFDVVLTITITAKLEEETAYLVEIQQAGIFLVRGFEGEDLRRILGTAAPGILFPYAREAIDAMCVKGGFPPVMLAPVNFDALYQQALQQQAQAPAGAEGGEAASH